MLSKSTCRGSYGSVSVLLVPKPFYAFGGCFDHRSVTHMVAMLTHFSGCCVHQRPSLVFVVELVLSLVVMLNRYCILVCDACRRSYLSIEGHPHSWGATESHTLLWHRNPQWQYSWNYTAVCEIWPHDYQAATVATELCSGSSLSIGDWLPLLRPSRCYWTSSQLSPLIIYLFLIWFFWGAPQGVHELLRLFNAQGTVWYRNGSWDFLGKGCAPVH